MPVDYKKLAQDNEAHSKLYNKIAQINALRQGDIPKAELLYGKELISRPTPIQTYQKQEEMSPRLKAIQDIKPPTLYDIGNVIRQAVPPTAILPAEPRIIYGDLDAGIDKEIIKSYTPDVLGKYYIDELPLPSQLVSEYSHGDIREYQDTVANLLKDLGRQKGTARRQHKDETYDLLSQHINALRAYHSRIKSITGNLEVLGSGKITYGKYQINKKKLGKGILSISYPNGKKVNSYPNMKISDGVKKVLLNNKINKKYDLSDSEKEFLRNVIDKSEAEVSKSKTKAVCNKTWDRMAVLLGEIHAGNTSDIVKNELADIAHHFYKKHELDKPKYSKILALI